MVKNLKDVFEIFLSFPTLYKTLNVSASKIRNRCIHYIEFKCNSSGNNKCYFKSTDDLFLCLEENNFFVEYKDNVLNLLKENRIKNVVLKDDKFFDLEFIMEENPSANSIDTSIIETEAIEQHIQEFLNSYKELICENKVLSDRVKELEKYKNQYNEIKKYINNV